MLTVVMKGMSSCALSSEQQKCVERPSHHADNSDTG